jgi:hypothetical protein
MKIKIHYYNTIVEHKVNGNSTTLYYSFIDSDPIVCYICGYKKKCLDGIREEPCPIPADVEEDEDE